jgi:outer membrane protein OmpA-like peptidoglycan-associated protein
MAELWMSGTLEAPCRGTSVRGPGGSGLSRWWSLAISHATIRGWTPVAGPPDLTTASKAPFTQATLEGVVKAATASAPDLAVKLTDVQVWNWRLEPSADGDASDRGVLTGTVYARVASKVPLRRGANDGADRVNRWGCLAVLLGLLVFSWLWFSCGPFTAMTWSVVVLASELGSRVRRRGRVPLSTPMLALHALAGVLLIIGAAGAVLGLADPGALASCDAQQVGRVLVVLAAVVGGSLLLIGWPLRWLWLAWTGVMLLWCGRTGTDCAEAWAHKGVEAVRALTPRALGGGFGAGARTSSGAPGDSVEPGSDGPASGGAGRGSGAGRGGTADRSGEAGAGGVGGSGKGLGQGGAGDGPADGTGGDSTRGAGVGGSRRGGGALGRDETDGGPSTPGPDPSGLEPHRVPQREPGASLDTGTRAKDELAATVPSASIDEALRDPRGFFSGERLVRLEGDLLFEFDEAQLQPRAEVPLRQLAKLLRMQPGQRVLVEGHADTIGGDAYNQTLSDERAAAVRTWLIDVAHINPGQLDFVGFGNSRPLVSASKSPAQQAPNRRVEVRVLP